jgi:hypothetical protein
LQLAVTPNDKSSIATTGEILFYNSVIMQERFQRVAA